MGAAMHVAGFQDVIATLWSIYDSIAPDMATTSTARCPGGTADSPSTTPPGR